MTLMDDREDRRAEAEARHAASRRPDAPPERDALMLRYLGAEMYAAGTGRSGTGGAQPTPDAPGVAEPTHRRPRVVVGIDGSDCARSALVFALDEASRRGADLHVVCAFSAPEYWATAYGMPAGPPLDELTRDIERVGRKMVDEAVGERDGAAAAVPVTVLALLGPAGKVLVEQSREADLLVLGHRGRGGLRSTVLGSVGLYCVLHAEAPVTVVRSTSSTAPAAEAAAM
jgi:nucleotide-binding universal stress UspA family protein